MSEKQNNKSEELLSLDELIAEAEEGDLAMRKKMRRVRQI